MTSRLHASHDIASAHTKGPWSFTRYGYEKHAITDDRGTEIGFVHRARDARLIAAAPKMYAALAAFEKQWNACGGNSHFGGLFQNVRDAAVEALAEADAAHWTNRAKQVQP